MTVLYWALGFYVLGMLGFIGDRYTGGFAHKNHGVDSYLIWILLWPRSQSIREKRDLARGGPEIRAKHAARRKQIGL